MGTKYPLSLKETTMWKNALNMSTSVSQVIYFKNTIASYVRVVANSIRSEIFNLGARKSANVNL